jgi:mannose-6-phosphate isomerase-like protein (cupin superfamily)
MQEFDLTALEEYRREKFVFKPLYEGSGSKAMLLHLLPEQEMPLHPHLEWEVTLLPRLGEAVMFGEDGVETVLKAGVLYYCGLAPVFGIQNRGPEPFQMLVLLIRTV